MSCPEYDELAELYDHVLPYRLRDDVAFFVEMALAAGGDVLEVACGTGRVLIPTARAGATVTGLDLSRGMLDVCRARLAAEPDDVGRRVTLHEDDMCTFDLGRTFALVTVPFRGFQHLLTVDAQRRALQRIRDHLAPGGRFVLDLFNPSLPLIGDERWLQAPLVEPEVVLPDGRRFVRSLRIVDRDWFEQVQTVEIVHEVSWPDGRRERRAGTTRLRYLFRFEAEHLLAREGFAIEALYGGYDKAPYGATYPGELVFVAVRR